MIGSAIASVAGGVMSYDSAKSAQKSSDRQTSLAQANREAAVSAIEGNQANVDALQEFMTSMGTQGVEYAQDLLDSWEGTFGGLQENLSSYYNSLDPTKFAMQEKTQFKQALDKQMSQYNETLSSSGLQSSGMRAQTMKEAAFKTAEANAQIDINAPEQVAQMQQGFLNYGDTQRAGAQNAYNAALANQAQYGLIGYNAQTNQASNIANAYNANAATQEQAAANYGASSAGYMQSAGNMLGAGANQFGSVPGMKTMMSGIDSGIMGSIGGATGASSIMSSIGAMSDVRLKKNVKFLRKQNGYNIYSWEWTELGKQLGGTHTEGVLAQEVRSINPDAVSVHNSGYLMVDHGKLI